MSDELEALFNEVNPVIKNVTPGVNKFCNGCKQTKPLDQFNNRKDRNSADVYGKVSKCKTCTRAAAQLFHERNREDQNKKGRTREYLKRHEGRLSEEEAVLLATNNIGHCDICSTYGMIYIDHDHDTNARRGYLCRNCNFGIGHFKDAPELLQKAASYLFRYKVEPNE